MTRINLTASQISALEANGCTAEDWRRVMVAPAFSPEHIRNVAFSGDVRLGCFNRSFTLAGGVSRHAGIRNATLHNVDVADDCLIENIHNYIANYRIGRASIIRNVNQIYVEGRSSFGNGVAVNVLNETGGREVYINDKLSAQMAYVMALYRHRPALKSRLKEITDYYTEKYSSSVGTIGEDVHITNVGLVRDVRVGDCCTISGAARLRNCSLNSNAAAPIHIGDGVICDDVIISSGSSVDEGATLARCFVGQACKIGHNYSASDSLFFSNCQGENGEACAIFAGPYTVTHHKSTLLIAGMFSFMNAGSGSNQSNHMYKLGPIHQGTLERGAKTTSNSYILWPARVGAFSLVMGRHTSHSDTTNLPFSYLIEQNNTTYLAPGVNLRSVGTIRDVKKWPVRDDRSDPNRLDCINFNLLSPYTVQKMLKGLELLRNLRAVSGELSDEYSFHSAKIKNSALRKGIDYYRTAVHKFMGNSIIKRLEGVALPDDETIRHRLRPTIEVGRGEWVDLSGLIAPKSEVDRVLEAIESGELNRLRLINAEWQVMHERYYEYEWTWVYDHIEEFYGIDPERITADDIRRIVNEWREAVVGLDRMVYEDARKEFSLASRTGFGADGTRAEKDMDFEQVRGDFESNPFVRATLDHIEQKSALGEELLNRLPA
ncbi:MAG: DUF4954 family protein [Alistipes sp.]|nr:DUF4954 family protein [Alistipes sp.]